MLAGLEPASSARAIFDEALKATALLVGALWTLMQYWRTHPNRQKPEVDVRGKFFKRNGKAYVSVHCLMQNVGQSEYWLVKRGSALVAWEVTKENLLRFSEMEKSPTPFWIERVFLEHAQMEAGTRIRDSKIIAIPDHILVEQIISFRIVLWVHVSAAVRFRQKISRRIYMALFVRALKNDFGRDFEKTYQKGITKRFGQNFNRLFDTQDAFARYFKEVFKMELDAFLGTRVPLRKVLWGILWNACKLKYTTYRTNCVIDIPRRAAAGVDQRPATDLVLAGQTRED